MKREERRREGGKEEERRVVDPSVTVYKVIFRVPNGEWPEFLSATRENPRRKSQRS